MQFIYNFNSLPFFNEKELILKDFFVNSIALEIKEILKKQNRAWDFIRIEAPSLIPRELINANYTNEDLWVVELAVTKGLSHYLDHFSSLNYNFPDNPNLLIKAVQYNQIHSIEKLLSLGINIHYQNDVALKLAAAANYLDIVKLLIEKGADIKASKALVLATPEVKEYLQSL